MNSQRRFSVDDEMVIAEEPLDTARSFGLNGVEHKDAPVLFAEDGDNSRKQRAHQVGSL